MSNSGYSPKGMLAQIQGFSRNGSARSLADLIIDCCAVCDEDDVVAKLAEKFPRTPNSSVFAKSVDRAIFYLRQENRTKGYSNCYEELIGCCGSMITHNK